MTEAGPSAGDDVTEDAFLGGALRLRQFRRGHRAGHDAILLAAATPVRAEDRVVEFGAGVGTAGLAVALRQPGITLTLVEIDPALAGLAKDNAGLNGIAARIVTLDVGAAAADFAQAGLGPDGCDVVLMNPPFHPADRHRASADPARRTAHLDEGRTLETWSHAARRVLRPGGVLSLIWRADGLGEVIAELARGFGGLEIRPVHPSAEGAAIRILVRAVKGSRAPLSLLPALVLNDAAGQPTPQAEAVLEGRTLM